MLLLQIATYASRPELRDRLKAALSEAKSGGLISREQVYECLLQTYLFAGFPAALEAMRALRAIWPKPESEEGVKPPPISYPEFVERGQKLFEKVYGANAERVKAEIRDLSPELGAWTMTDGYSKTLSRSGLDAVSRELVTVAAITQLGWERQLFSHILGAQNCGASAEQVQTAIEIGAMGDAEKLNAALKLLKRI
jgi:4-carboxymuconolactone decarboxylase